MRLENQAALKQKILGLSVCRGFGEVCDWTPWCWPVPLLLTRWTWGAGLTGKQAPSSAPTLPCQAALHPGHGGPCLGGVA